MSMTKTLLVVDDSIFIYEELKRIAENIGFTVVGWAKDGESAIAMYEQLKPDLVTMDIILPGIDGLDATRMLLQRWPDARVVVISSLAYDETIKESAEVGARGFIFKPFDDKDVIPALMAACQ